MNDYAAPTRTTLLNEIRNKYHIKDKVISIPADKELDFLTKVVLKNLMKSGYSIQYTLFI